jgi:hypothetical protein
MRNSCRILVCKLEEKRLLEITSHRWEDTFKISLKEIGCYNDDWIHLT